MTVSRRASFLASVVAGLLFSATVLGEERVAAQLVKVVDGDTLVVYINARKERVRVIGIDSPEEWPSKKLDRDVERTQTDRATMVSLGLRSANHMKSLLRGKSLVLVFPPARDRRDRYQRLLAYIEADGQDLGARMIRDGYAYPYRRFPHPRLDAYDVLFREAVPAKAGLWADQEAGRFDQPKAAKRKTRRPRKKDADPQP